MAYLAESLWISLNMRFVNRKRCCHIPELYRVRLSETLYHLIQLNPCPDHPPNRIPPPITTDVAELPRLLTSTSSFVYASACPYQQPAPCHGLYHGSKHAARVYPDPMQDPIPAQPALKRTMGRVAQTSTKAHKQQVGGIINKKRGKVVANRPKTSAPWLLKEKAKC